MEQKEGMTMTIDEERQQRLLEGMPLEDLKRNHRLISQELVERGVAVDLVLRPEMEERIAPYGKPHKTVLLAGLGEALDERKISAAELARRAGTGYRTVRDAAAGKTRTRIDLATRIANELGMSIDELRIPPPTLQPLDTLENAGNDHQRGAA